MLESRTYEQATAMTSHDDTIPTDGMVGEHASMLRLDEYDSASRDFFSDAVQAVAHASDPILGQIARETVEVLPTSVNTMASGVVVSHEPLLATAEVTFSVSSGIEGDLSDVHAAIAATAEQFVATMMPRFFENISALCDASGNVVSQGGQPTWEGMLDAIETLSIAFDEDGNPFLPSIVMHPDTAASIGDPPDDYQARLNEIIARRQDEWLAGRRPRRLPRLRH